MNDIQASQVSMSLHWRKPGPPEWWRIRDEFQDARAQFSGHPGLKDASLSGPTRHASAMLGTALFVLGENPFFTPGISGMSTLFVFLMTCSPNSYLVASRRGSRTHNSAAGAH